MIARENLERQGYTCYLPLCRRRRRRMGKFVAMIESLFPRYLFISLDSQNDDWSPIRSTRGVLSLVRFGNRPATVPDALIDMMRARDDADGIQALPEPGFRSGDAVRVTAGAMAGYEALFLARKGCERVLLLMDILGKQTRIEIAGDWIEAAV